MATNKQPNLKVNVNSDTSGFTKGMSEAKKELKAFNQTGDKALSGIAGALGVNLEQVKKLQDAFAGAGRKIAAMGKEGSEALGQMVAAAGKAATAIGAIGIGAAVTAFKLLNEEATAFKNTIQGANIELQTKAYIDTYRQAMRDSREEIGRGFAEAQASMEKSRATFWGRMASNIQPMTGTATGIAAMGDVYQKQLEFQKQANDLYQSAIDKAERGEAIQGQIYELQRKQSDATRRWADLQVEITEQRRIAYDQEESILDRQNALIRARELINQRYGEQYEIQKQISDLTDQYNDLTSSSPEDIDKANQLYVQAANNLSSMNQELRSLSRLSSTIARTAAEEAAARQATADAIAKGVERMQEYATAQVEMHVGEDSVRAIQDFLSTAIAVKPVEVPVQLQTEQVQKQLLDLNDVIQQTLVEGVEGIAEAIGNLLGNLTNGEGGVAEFGQDMLTMFGSFAQKFGKVLVAFGVAVEAAKVSAESFNGIVAIAAGGALIAAGAAVKQMASNMASSMGAVAASPSSYVASPSSYGSGSLSNSTLQVEVTGTLTANGSQLVAVLNNEGRLQRQCHAAPAGRRPLAAPRKERNHLRLIA